MNPKLFECFVVAFGLLAFGLFILIKSQILSFDLPNWLMKYGLWFLSIVFIIRAIGEFKYIGFFKKIKTTKFGQLDTKYYSPLCLVISFLAIALELLGWKLLPTLHCCKCGWTDFYSAWQKYGIWLSLLNRIAANATPDSNALTLAATLLQHSKGLLLSLCTHINRPIAE